ncbi:MAG: hypothetical protein DSY91_00645 [Deltaproteobacteria bacterium]|nr:MAG: hypothetical protein DSY91_00645 [Deltaproteobacteria bacterium]
MRYAHYFDEIHTYLAEACLGLEKNLLSSGGKLKLRKFRRLPTALQRAFLESVVLEKGYMDEPLSFEQLESVLRLTQSSAGTRKYRIRKDLWVIREYDRLYFTQSLSKEAIRPVTCSVPGSVEIREIGNRLKIKEVKLNSGGPLLATSREAYVSGDQMGDTVWVRGFQPGDRIVTNGTVKLKKLFIDAKVPARVRPAIPIIGSGNDIIWVAGLRVDRRFYVTKETRRVLRLSFQRPVEIK